MIESFQQNHPNIADDVYIAEQALVIGRVTLASHVSIWPGAIVRGDVHDISIGAYSNIQDQCVCHVTHQSHLHQNGFALTIGEYVTVGHGAILHGCQIKDRVLCGIGSIILDGAIVESDCLIAAGSLVPPGKLLKSGYLYLGNPVQAIRELTREETESIQYNAKHYCRLKQTYLEMTNTQ